jgi:hypothetical protein
MASRSRRLVKFFVRVLVTAGLLVWVFTRIDLQQFWQAARMARWQFLIAVWVLTGMFFWMQSVTLRIILKKLGCNVDIATIFGASAITSLYGMVLPGVLGSGVKWYILKKDTGKGSNVLAGMLYNQLSIVVVMAILGLAALIVINPTSLLFTNPQRRWLLPLVCGILLAAIMLAFLLLLYTSMGSKIIKALGVLLQPFPAKIREKGQLILDHIVLFQTAGPRFHLTIASINVIASLVGGMLAYILSAKAANITAPAGILLSLSAIVFILGRMPISIANLGVREVTLVETLSLYGVQASAALLMSMILFSALIVMAIIGAIYQLSWAVAAKQSLARKT